MEGTLQDLGQLWLEQNLTAAFKVSKGGNPHKLLQQISVDYVPLFLLNNTIPGTVSSPWDSR